MNASNAALVTAISGSGSSARALQSHTEFGHGEIRGRVGRLGAGMQLGRLGEPLHCEPPQLVGL